MGEVEYLSCEWPGEVAHDLLEHHSHHNHHHHLHNRSHHHHHHHHQQQQQQHQQQQQQHHHNRLQHAPAEASGSDEQRAARSVRSKDPLADPVVQITLQEMQLTCLQLINMSVKELNKRLGNYSPGVVAKLKRCRRTLKNRGYAKNCRFKRIAVKNQLEQLNAGLTAENKELRQRNRLLWRELAKWRQYYSSPTNGDAYFNNGGFNPPSESESALMAQHLASGQEQQLAVQQVQLLECPASAKPCRPSRRMAGSFPVAAENYAEAAEREKLAETIVETMSLKCQPQVGCE